jgi:hypothetical protein
MRTNPKDKFLFFEAFILCGIIRMIILLIPFNKIRNSIGGYNQDNLKEVSASEYKVVKRVARAIYQATKYTPWESKCLVQALTAQRMLKKRKIYSTLYLGVAKEGKKKVKAHAWLRCGQVFVTGGYEKKGFVQVAKFYNGGID